MKDKDINMVMEEIARSHVVENIVYKINRNEERRNLEDLIQDIYIQLLTKPEKTIEIYNNKQLNFFVTRIVMNNICSSTSPYFTKYKKHIGEDIYNIAENKLIYE